MRIKRLNERGFGPIEIIIILVVLAVIGGGAYYFFSKKNDSQSSSNLTSQESKALEGACMDYINDKDYCRFASNWSMNEDRIITMKAPEDSMVMTVRSSGSNSHSTITTDGTVTSEIIVLDNVSYMKNMADGSWTKYTNNTSSGLDSNISEYTPDFDFSNEEVKDTHKINKLGKEACGELTCFKYQMLDSTEPDAETIIWFDDKDYKIRRMTAKNSDGVSEMTFSYEKVTISQPSPVIEAPNYENMSPEELQQQIESLRQ